MEKILWWLLVCGYLTLSAQSGDNSDEVASLDDIKGILPLEKIAQLLDSLGLGNDDDYFFDDVNPDYHAQQEIQTGVKVVVGSLATSGDYPHQVSLRDTNDNDKHFCGASVIHPWLLLSAAHCFEIRKPPHVQAIAGEHDLKVPDGNEQVRNVTHVIVHENYNPTTLDNDIAILVLNESLQFDNYVSQIKLRNPKWELPAMAHVSGWGGTNNSSSTDQLMCAKLHIRRLEVCKARLKKNVVTENMICAGGKQREDVCEGDSGGPLTCARNGTNGQQQRYLCGIVSFGIPCTNRVYYRYPGVYTDVSKYYKWVHKYMRTWWTYHWVTALAESISEADDCSDGSFQCPSNGLCLPEQYKCDGEVDCHPLDDDWDETNCGSAMICPGTKFQCGSPWKCIPRNYVCDGVEDCGDGSDEANCN